MRLMRVTEASKDAYGGETSSLMKKASGPCKREAYSHGQCLSLRIISADKCPCAMHHVVPRTNGDAWRENDGKISRQSFFLRLATVWGSTSLQLDYRPFNSRPWTRITVTKVLTQSLDLPLRADQIQRIVIPKALFKTSGSH
jgi:hypothetical protein